MTETRIVWCYDDDAEPVARTSWAHDGYSSERLHSAAYEGIGRWATGEPLEDALGLVEGTGYYCGAVLEVEYLAGASRSGGNGRSVGFRLEEREEGDDEEGDEDDGG